MSCRLGRVDEAIARFDDALAIKPDFEEGISLKIFVSDFRADLTFVEQRNVRQVWWERVGSRIEVPPRQPHGNVRDPRRRLVVGLRVGGFSRALGRPGVQAVRNTATRRRSKRYAIRALWSRTR